MVNWYRTVGYYTYIDNSTTTSAYSWPSTYITTNVLTGRREWPSYTGDALERLRGMRERRAAGRDVAA